MLRRQRFMEDVKKSKVDLKTRTVSLVYHCVIPYPESPTHCIVRFISSRITVYHIVRKGRYSQNTEEHLKIFLE
jgi:hypothetical protein